MEFNELCEVYKNKPSLDFYKQKKIVEFEDQPERLNPEDHIADVSKMVCDSLTPDNK